MADEVQNNGKDETVDSEKMASLSNRLKEKAVANFLEGLKTSSAAAGKLEAELIKLQKTKRGNFSGINVGKVEEEDLEQIAQLNNGLRGAWLRLPFRKLDEQTEEWRYLTEEIGHDLYGFCLESYFLAASFVGLDNAPGERLAVDQNWAKKLGFVFDPVIPRATKIIIENFIEEISHDKKQETFDLKEQLVDVARVLMIKHTFQEVLATASKEQKRGRLKMRFSFSGDLRIIANKSGLFRVWENLLTNALKSVEEARCSQGKEGIITVSAIADETHSYIKAAITDNGLGIDKEAVVQAALEKGKISEGEAVKITQEGKEISLIFEGNSVFGQKGVGGTGSGLVSSQRTIESAKGKIMADNNVSFGAHFVVELPVGA